MGDLNGRLADKRIAVSTSPAAQELLLQRSYDPACGARPLRRFIEKHIVVELSRQIISGELRDDSDITVDASNGQLVFEVAHRAPSLSGSRSLSPMRKALGEGLYRVAEVPEKTIRRESD